MFIKYGQNSPIKRSRAVFDYARKDSVKRVHGLQKCGVGLYRIGCKECDKIYRGETERKLQIHLMEHKREEHNQTIKLYVC